MIDAQDGRRRKPAEERTEGACYQGTTISSHVSKDYEPQYSLSVHIGGHPAQECTRPPPPPAPLAASQNKDASSASLMMRNSPSCACVRARVRASLATRYTIKRNMIVRRRLIISYMAYVLSWRNSVPTYISYSFCVASWQAQLGVRSIYIAMQSRLPRSL